MGLYLEARRRENEILQEDQNTSFDPPFPTCRLLQVVDPFGGSDTWGAVTFAGLLIRQTANGMQLDLQILQIGQ